MMNQYPHQHKPIHSVRPPTRVPLGEGGAGMAGGDGGAGMGGGADRVIPKVLEFCIGLYL